MRCLFAREERVEFLADFGQARRFFRDADVCALTRTPLRYHRRYAAIELLASPDRVLVDGHYTPDIVQIVCRSLNRWKGANDDSRGGRFPLCASCFDASRQHRVDAA